MNVTRIIAPNPGPFTGTGTNSYVVSADGRAVVIDPGPVIDSHLDAIRSAVRALQVVGVLVTHHHLDHSPAANPLAAEFGVPSYGFGAFGGFQAISAAADGDDIRVGTEVIEVLATPGHTPDSLSFAATAGVFTGDTIKTGSTVVVEDMTAYMATLERLAALAPQRLYPGHGELITDAPAVIAAYLAHRRQREQQVLAALGERPATLTAVVADVYSGLDPVLIPLAARSTRAHLDKLVAEGRVRQEGEEWALR